MRLSLAHETKLPRLDSSYGRRQMSRKPDLTRLTWKSFAVGRSLLCVAFRASLSVSNPEFKGTCPGRAGEQDVYIEFSNDWSSTKEARVKVLDLYVFQCGRCRHTTRFGFNCQHKVVESPPSCLQILYVRQLLSIVNLPQGLSRKYCGEQARYLRSRSGLGSSMHRSVRVSLNNFRLISRGFPVHNLPRVWTSMLSSLQY